MSGTEIPKRLEIVRPGLFGSAVAADNRRLEFDYQNEQIIATEAYPDVVFLGDSITHMWELSAYFPWRVVNRGIGGDITEMMEKRFAADVLQLKPKAVVILGGVNDTGAVANEYIWGKAGKSQEEIVADAVRHLTTMAAAAKEKSIIPVLCSVLPSDMHYLPHGAVTNQMIVNINEGLRSFASETGVQYLDYHQAFVDADGLTLRPGLAYDGLHPHYGGYRIMADMVLGGVLN